ncbi:MAG: transposase [Rhodothermaceae bacterium]|nr:transposase [Rhodothermaceae bacterium]MYD56424.1 transposase [Rhodothermaceae bacterium]MYJ55067.1 transposase [Rhodothermaceae bacterium]
MSDEFTACRNAGIDYRHSIIHLAHKFAEGNVHVSNIESFRVLVKRAWFGPHYHYSRKYMPLFLSGSCWKYNHRYHMAPFDAFVDGIVRRL